MNCTVEDKEVDRRGRERHDSVIVCSPCLDHGDPRVMVMVQSGQEMISQAWVRWKVRLDRDYPNHDEADVKDARDACTRRKEGAGQSSTRLDPRQWRNNRRTVDGEATPTLTCSETFRDFSYSGVPTLMTLRGVRRVRCQCFTC